MAQASGPMHVRNPEATTILMARHGETQWNLVRRMQGQKDSPLTEKGIRQAENLKKMLISRTLTGGKTARITSAWCSCLGRAVKTAEICANGLDIGLEKAEGLNEIALGKWEGLSFEEAEKMSPEQFYNFWHRPSKYVPTPGGETFQQVQARMVDALKRIHERHPGENILVVSHWIAIKTALAGLQNLGLDDIHRIPKIKNGSFHIIRMTNTRADVTYYT